MPIKTTYPMRRASSAPPSAQMLSCEAVDAAAMPPACGARTRSGAPCRALAMRNGRCRMHGGVSTGARTAAGLERVRTVGLIHGGRSRATRDFRRMVREVQSEARRMVELA